MRQAQIAALAWHAKGRFIQHETKAKRRPQLGRPLVRPVRRSVIDHNEFKLVEWIRLLTERGYGSSQQLSAVECWNNNGNERPLDHFPPRCPAVVECSEPSRVNSNATIESGGAVNVIFAAAL